MPPGISILTPIDQQSLLATAHLAADAARTAIAPYFRTQELALVSKDADGFDPVTIADKSAEEAMREIISRQRPADAILGEEFGHKAGSSGLTWVLDPIDGTRAFIAGAPVWGVLIAVVAEKGPIFGIIDQPHIGERFVGGLGNATLDHRGQTSPLSVRACADLAEATLLTTFPEIGTAQEEAAFARVRDQVRLTRYGLDCYGYALVAIGQVDLVIEAGLESYDIAAPIAVVQAAGGIVTDWQGGPVHEGGQVIAAGDRRMHSAALELLNA